MLIHLYRPRKFSFDPKAKKLFHCTENDTYAESFHKFYKNGKIVNNDDANTAVDDMSGTEEPTLLSFLKSELTSEPDQDNMDDEEMYDVEKEKEQQVLSDEEMASMPL